MEAYDRRRLAFPEEQNLFPASQRWANLQKFSGTGKSDLINGARSVVDGVAGPG